MLHQGRWIWVVLIAVLLSAALPIESIAQGAGGGGGGNKDATCTNAFENNDSNQGILTQIIDYIKQVIEQATQELYTGIIQHPAFLNALNAAFILFITLFGVMFIFGIVPFTLGQCVVRGMKMGVILAMINVGFPFFKEYAIKFFNDGTDELISAVIGIATGDRSPVSYSAAGSPQPFTKLEGVVKKVLSSKNMVAIIGSATTGPMGPAMGGLLGMATMVFVQTIVKALKTYCLSLIAKALLFGLAPIFITFLLFERTKYIFSAWVNQLVNYSLQPLFMFAFLSFFIVMMESAIDNILKAELCWTEFENVEGGASATSMWRFKTKDGKVSSSDFTFQGLAQCLQQGSGSCPDFPISIVDGLTFLILVHLAYKFSDVVTQIASEIAGAQSLLDKVRGGMGEYFQGMGNNKKAANPPNG